MTDELMDARLRSAGESWRAANTIEAEVDDASGEHLDLGVARPRHRTRWLTIASAAVVAAALAVSGVVFARTGTQHKRPPAVEGAPVSQLVGVTWKDQNSAGTVVFTADTARTFDGCSNALYRLTVDRSVLGTGKQIGTSSTCTGNPGPPPGAASAPFLRAAANLAKFYKILRGPSHWSVVGKTLTVTSAGGATITLTTNSDPAPALVGTSWVLSRVMTDSELPGSYSSATLSIDSSGIFTANDLCNTLNGKAKVTASTVDFGNVSTTEIACIDPGFTPATKVIDKVLSGAATYAIRGNELMIEGDRSSGTLVYLPAPPKTTTDDLTALTSQPWTLTGTETSSTSGNGSSGSGSSAVSESVVQFDGDNGFTVQHRCYTNEGNAVIGTRTIDFSQVRTKYHSHCPVLAGAAAEQQEDAFVDALLDGHVTWTIDSDELTLTDKLGHAATFAAPTGPRALLGSRWKLNSIAHGTAPDSAVSSAPAVVFKFFIDGATDSGDNAASIKLTVKTIRFTSSWINGVVGKTGAPGFDEADERFVHDKLLIGTVAWSITGNQLTLTKAGVGALVFTKA